LQPWPKPNSSCEWGKYVEAVWKNECTVGCHLQKERVSFFSSFQLSGYETTGKEEEEKGSTFSSLGSDSGTSKRQRKTDNAS
jgi:hypothetical protein